MDIPIAIMLKGWGNILNGGCEKLLLSYNTKLAHYTCAFGSIWLLDWTTVPDGPDGRARTIIMLHTPEQDSNVRLEVPFYVSKKL